MIGNLIEQWRKSGWMSPPGVVPLKIYTGMVSMTPAVLGI